MWWRIIYNRISSHGLGSETCPKALASVVWSFKDSRKVREAREHALSLVTDHQDCFVPLCRPYFTNEVAPPGHCQGVGCFALDVACSAFILSQEMLTSRKPAVSPASLRMGICSSAEGPYARPRSPFTSLASFSWNWVEKAQSCQPLSLAASLWLRKAVLSNIFH